MFSGTGPNVGDSVGGNVRVIKPGICVTSGCNEDSGVGAIVLAIEGDEGVGAIVGSNNCSAKVGTYVGSLSACCGLGLGVGTGEGGVVSV